MLQKTLRHPSSFCNLPSRLSIDSLALSLTLALFQALARVRLVFAGAEAVPEDQRGRRSARRWPWRPRPSRSRPQPFSTPSRPASGTFSCGGPPPLPRSRGRRRPLRTLGLRGRSRCRAARTPACRRWGRRCWGCRRSRGRGRCGAGGRSCRSERCTEMVKHGLTNCCTIADEPSQPLPRRLPRTDRTASFISLATKISGDMRENFTN